MSKNDDIHPQEAGSSDYEEGLILLIQKTIMKTIYTYLHVFKTLYLFIIYASRFFF